MSLEGVHQIGRRAAAVITYAMGLMLLVEGGAFGILRWRALRELTLADPHTSLMPYRNTDWGSRYWSEMKLVQRTPEYYPYVVWRRAPYAGSTIAIDAEGRRRTLHSTCAPGAYTIAMFGGSTLWGYGAPDWGTIPTYLAEEFERRGRPVCVRNYGEFGWVATQGLVQLVLELKAGRRRPDLVISYDGCNDVLTPLQSGRVDVHANFGEIKAWHDGHRQSALGSFGWLAATNTAVLAGRLAERLGLRPSGWQTAVGVEPLARRIADDYLAGVDLAEALAARYGFRYASFLQPNGLLERKPLTPEEAASIETARDARHRPLPALYERTYALLRQADRPGLHYIADVFNGERESFYLDICHVAPAGNRLVAHRMYEILSAGNGNR